MARAATPDGSMREVDEDVSTMSFPFRRSAYAIEERTMGLVLGLGYHTMSDIVLFQVGRGLRCCMPITSPIEIGPLAWEIRPENRFWLDQNIQYRN